MNRNLLLIVFVVLLTSCVPSKDLIYLQGNPVSKKEIHKINNTPYKLQVDDIISIDIKSVNDDLVKLFKKEQNNAVGNNVQSNQNASYFTGYSVDLHGNIRLPYLGEINVLGYTTKEVREKVEKELWKLFKNKEDIFVTVKLSGIRYTIIGEVNNPGPKVIYQNRISIIDAVSNAGDITLTGNRKKVEVVRPTIGGNEKFTVDLTKMTAFESKVFYIKPNDIINILPLKQKAWGTGTTGLQSLTTVISIFSLITSTIILARNL